MTITFYKLTCEPEYVNKLPYLTAKGSFEGFLRDGSDLLDPSFTVDTTNVLLDVILPEINYFYVEEWGRYYYLTDLSVINNKLWSLSGHVDVLYTYQQQIKTNSAIIARQEYQYNLEIMDNKLVVESGRVYTTSAFPGRVEPASTSQDYGSIVLTIAGGAGT